MLEVSPDSVPVILKSLAAGQVVALPTETVYGLAAALNSTSALEKLIYLKRRDLKSGKVFSLVPESVAAIEKYANLSPPAQKYIQAYLPGELTLILPKNPNFTHPYFDHFSTVGIRLPKSSLFKRLLPAAGPLFLTAANPRGDAPATNSETIKDTLPKVDLLVQGATPAGALPTTILDLTTATPVIIRQGSLQPQMWYNQSHESLQPSRNRSEMAKNLGRHSGLQGQRRRS